MRKIELYLVTVVGVCLLMMFGCADKHQAFSADSAVSSAAETSSRSSSPNCKAPPRESPLSPVPTVENPDQRVQLGSVVFESYPNTAIHSAYYQFVAGDEVVYKKIVGTDCARLLTVEYPGEVSPHSPSKSNVNAAGSALFKLDDDAPPGVVVETGSSDRYNYDIFDLTKKPEKVTAIVTPSSLTLLKIGRRVHLLKHVGQYHIEFGARGGAPDIILKWTGARFILDTEAMCSPPPTKAEIASLTAQFKQQIAYETNNAELTDPVQLELAPDILDLYYQGRGRLAKRIFNKTWPRNRHGRKRYWHSVMKIAAKTEYWSQIKAMSE